MTQEIINRLKELLTKATEGPWEVQPRTFSTTFFLVRRDRTTDEHCIADVTRREDADAIAAVFNLLSTLTNLTPSGVERINLSDAFAMGFDWAMMLRGQTLEDSRAVGRTLSCDLFEPIAEEIAVELKRRGFNSFKSSDHGIVAAKQIIRAALALPSEPPSQGDVEGWARELLAAEYRIEFMAIYTDNEGNPPSEESWLQRAVNSPASIRAIVKALASKEDGRP